MLNWWWYLHFLWVQNPWNPIGYILHLQARLIFGACPCREIQLPIFSPLYLINVTRRRIASQPVFVFSMFPMCCLRRSQNHLRFHPIIVVQTSNFIYICITWRREAVHSLNTSLPLTSRLWSLSKAYILSPQNSKFKWWLLWFWLSSSSKSSSIRPIYVGVLGATTFGTYTSLLWSNTDFFLLMCYFPWLKKLL